jgi:hypothetical protein
LLKVKIEFTVHFIPMGKTGVEDAGDEDPMFMTVGK